MRSLGLTQNANVMLQWVPMIGPNYIMLIVMVNSSDHSGVKEQDERLRGDRGKENGKAE